MRGSPDSAGILKCLVESAWIILDNSLKGRARRSEWQMHLAWRWFTGLSFDQEIPHHSTFSKSRHGRFQESNLFQQLFEQIVDRYMEAGLVEGEHLSVDGSFIQANASRSSRIPREQLPEAAHVKRTVREAMIYKRGRVYWYKFHFLGAAIRESTKQGNRKPDLAL